jgi:hypothetical protein
MLAAAYDYLRTTLPFKNWKLPESDAVEFHVTRHRDRFGDHNAHRLAHIIRISSYHTKTTALLIETMAHEIIHAKLAAKRGRSEHDEEFKYLSRRVCATHGWDLAEFVG